MGHALLNLPESVGLLGLTHGISDDFQDYLSGGRFTSVLTDSGTVAAGDAAGGVVTLTPSDGTVADNDEAYMKSTQEVFKFAAGKPLVAECRLKFTEANTDDANVAFGLKDAVAANSILDDGGGPAASYSGCVFFKTDGDTVWNAESSNGATQKTDNLVNTVSLDKLTKTAGGGVYQTLKIEATPNGGGLIDFAFYIDGALVARHKDRSYSSATEMQLFVGVKNGGANLETVLVDYIRCHQVR